ncbi:MAG: hypothetical protein AB9903_22335 [Vulcanimicrobiota bacterium]
MAECMDGEWEVEQIEREQAQFPSFEDIRAMRIQLGFKNDSRRLLTPEDAWAYYHELKATMEAKQRKTA